MTLSAPVATSPDGPWRAREVDAAPVGDGSPLRQTSIDVLRSIAICLMIVVHFVENLSAGHDAASTALAATLPAGVAAPLFLFLVGVNYRLWADMQADRGRSSTSVSKRSVRRGLFLVGAGFAFNVLVWLPEDTFNWDVLTFVGIALLVLDVARRMPPSAVVCGAGIILAISPVLRGVADYAAYWQQPWFDYDFTLSDVALGGLVVGYFPLFPWLVLPLTGFLVAPLIFGSRGRPSRCFGIAGGLAAVSAGVLAVWPLLPDRWRAGAADGWSMFPASTAYILGSTALALASLVLLHTLLDRPAASGWRERPAAWTGPFSRHSFSIYVLHHIVHVWPLWIADLTGDADVTCWQTALPASAALALAAACIVGCGLLFVWVDRLRLPSLESLMRWVCD
jgi:uncharacterized membrane protein